MYGKPVLFLLALTLLGITAEQRKLHRLVGGHLRIINPDPDDSELMKLEASGSREKKQKSDQEEKKTLAQQVADGKYGLIQKELFSKPQKRPGVLSYDDNDEVPNDNKDNLGGLHKNEIWLAENHLLVIRGGTYPPHEEKPNHAATLWPPIDDFKAPLHQVKIPKHPKVPPPFPVQFTDDGPLQILGTNTSRTLNESVAPEGYALPPPDGYQPNSNSSKPPDHPNPANATPWQTPVPISFYPPGEYPQGVPFPPFPLNGTLPPYFASLPPGAVILPPPGNQSDLYDEDDPSIYYPPPYSFYYPKDNSSLVQAGPLVPGIILPPPPNFFGPLEETTTTTTRIPQRQRKPTTKENPQIHPTTTPLPPTEKSTTKKPFKVYPVQNSYQSNEVSSPHPIKEANVVTVLPARQPNRTNGRTSKPQTQRKKPQITVLQPVRGNTSPPTYYENEISDKPFVSYGPPRATKKSSVTTTQVPLRYFTTVNEIETNSVTQPAVKLHTPEKTTQKPIQFYFYEEEFDPNSGTTQQTPIKQSTYVPNDYYVQPKPTPVRQRKPQYIYVNARPYNTQKPKFRYIPQPVKTDTFSIHIAKLQNQINQYYTTSRPTYKPVHSPKPVYQFSFQAANYQPQQSRFKPSQPDLNQEDQFRPIPKYSVQIQQAIEIIPTESPQSYQQTPSPVYYQQNYQESSERPGRYYTTNRPNYAYQTITQNTRYQNVVTPKPISQYSFEVTPNPIYQGFYTKPDESYFDDNTKKYFTMFGRKLPSSTSPIPIVEQTTVKPNYVYSNQQQQTSLQHHQKPVSLETDTLVNYVHPRPTINPDAELIPVNNPPPSTYPKVIRYPARPAQYVQPQKQPQREENPEIIKAIPIEIPSEDGQEGSFISYQLPGDRGAHFYFLTPQLSQRRDQGSNYYYSQPNTSRTRRNEDKDKER